MISRENCAICETNLIQITQLNDHVVSYSPTIHPSIDSIKECFPIGYCNHCYSMQFMKLVEPSILYKDSHNETFNTPTWKQHHSMFYEFSKDILNNITTCIEVGGAQCILLDKVKKDYPSLNYSILDIIEQPLTDHIIKVGNCEEYNFTEECVILSHVFEHLHNPKLFLKNVMNSSITYVIMSVPNLEYLLEQDNLNVIHIEHTFYYNHSHLNYLFNEISFSCINSQKFNNHSLFYIFKRNITSSDVPIFKCNNNLLDYYSNRQMKLDMIDLTINNDIWIAPAGHYGYIIYSYLIEKGHSSKIKAFIDNDTSKQGRYLNGSDVKIVPYSELINKTNITVILYAGVYTKEICSQITQLNENVKIICI